MVRSTLDTSGISGGTATVQFNCPDSGSAVPTAGGIITLTEGAGIDITCAVANTIDFALDLTEVGTVATTYNADTGSATPSGNALTIAGGTGISTSGSSATITIDLDTPVSVANGGTGATTLTDGGIILGSGTSAVTVTSQPTNGQLLIGSTGVDPVLAVLTEGTGIDVTNGAGSITIAVDTTEITDIATSFVTDSGTATPASNILNIVGGEGIDTSGSGNTVTVAGEDASDTNKGIASFQSADFDVTSGDVALEDTVVKSVSSDSGTATPSGHSFTIAGGANIDTSGSGATITIAATGAASFSWTEVTGTSQSMAVNSGYILNNAGLVTATLPSTAAVGDVVRVAGKGAGGWKIAQNAGQTIHFGSSDTTTGAGGSLDSTNRYDAIELLCVTANTDFVALSSIGNISVT